MPRSTNVWRSGAAQKRQAGSAASASGAAARVSVWTGTSIQRGGTGETVAAKAVLVSIRSWDDGRCSRDDPCGAGDPGSGPLARRRAGGGGGVRRASSHVAGDVADLPHQQRPLL